MLSKDYHYNETEELFYQLEGEHYSLSFKKTARSKAMDIARLAICICIQPKHHIHPYVPKTPSAWSSNANAPVKDSKTAYSGSAKIATTNSMKSISNSTISKMISCHITNISTILWNCELATIAAPSWKPTRVICNRFCFRSREPAVRSNLLC